MWDSSALAWDPGMFLSNASSITVATFDPKAVRRAGTAPTVLTQSVDEQSDVDPEDEYRCTEEYYHAYYNQHPRDPRLLPPIRMRSQAKPHPRERSPGMEHGPGRQPTRDQQRLQSQLLPADLLNSPPCEVVEGTMPPIAHLQLDDLEPPPELETPSTLPSGTKIEPMAAAPSPGAPPAQGADPPSPSPGLTLMQNFYIGAVPTAVISCPPGCGTGHVVVEGVAQLPRVMLSPYGQPQHSPHARGAAQSNRGRGRKGAQGAAAPPGALVPDDDPPVRKESPQHREPQTMQQVAGRVADLSRDQDGSRLIQRLLEVPSNVATIFQEIFPTAVSLMTDVFGNYVIQKLLETASREEFDRLVGLLHGEVLRLSTQTYGCRVVQKALDQATDKERLPIMQQLDGHIAECVLDQNANHVVQKCVELMPQSAQFIIDSFLPDLDRLACHAYGCRVIQRLFEKCCTEPSVDTAHLLLAVLERTHDFVTNQYGNYVVQHAMLNSPYELQHQFIGMLTPRMYELSCSKFASNVAEKIIELATGIERDRVIVTLTGTTPTSPSVVQRPQAQQQQPEANCLVHMMQDPYANYVVQKLFDLSTDAQRAVMANKIREWIPMIRRGTYGRHLLARMEKSGAISPGDAPRKEMKKQSEKSTSQPSHPPGRQSPQRSSGRSAAMQPQFYAVAAPSGASYIIAQPQTYANPQAPYPVQQHGVAFAYSGGGEAPQGYNLQQQHQHDPYGSPAFPGIVYPYNAAPGQGTITYSIRNAVLYAPQPQSVAHGHLSAQPASPPPCGYPVGGPEIHSQSGAPHRQRARAPPPPTQATSLTLGIESRAEATRSYTPPSVPSPPLPADVVAPSHTRFFSTSSRFTLPS